MTLFDHLRIIRSRAMTGFFTGQGVDDPYFMSCRHALPKYGCSIVFTRDVGAHTSGWKKNPDFEQCYHLSIAFKGGVNKKLFVTIMDFLFGENKRKLLIESPYSKVGKSLDVWHYRLFCDEHWRPMIPKGEPYNTDNTPVDFKTFSEVHKG